MKTYIKVWAVIILFADLVTFGYLVSTGGSFIKRSKEYKKIYPCKTISVVVSDITDLSSVGSYSLSDTDKESFRYENDDKEPSIHEVARKDTEFKYFGEIIIFVDTVLIGIAVLLYNVLSNMKYRPEVSLGFSFILFLFLIGAGFGWAGYYRYLSTPGEIKEVHYNAPIIYLYDEKEREATVRLDLHGDLTCTYPRYNDKTGWVVKTSSDGVLTDRSGRQYEYLYWEADLNMTPDLSHGFCVRGEDSADFLEIALSDLGLSDTEANAFIMYWLPQLEENPYNVISFQNETYENAAKLDVDPLPDTVVRVNMVFYGSDEYVEIKEQDLRSMNPSLAEREGFVLVEWGGGKLG